MFTNWTRARLGAPSCRDFQVSSLPNQGCTVMPLAMGQRNPNRQLVDGKHPILLFGLKYHTKLVVQDFATIRSMSSTTIYIFYDLKSFSHLIIKDIAFEHTLNQAVGFQRMRCQTARASTPSMRQGTLPEILGQKLGSQLQDKVETWPEKNLQTWTPKLCWKMDIIW